MNPAPPVTRALPTDRKPTGARHRAGPSVCRRSDDRCARLPLTEGRVGGTSQLNLSVNLRDKESRCGHILLLVRSSRALACGSTAGAAGKGTTLSVVAYSTPKTVFGKIVEAWQATPQGKGVSFVQSYGASGDQAKAVAAGLRADIVFLSTGLDVDTLVDAGPRRSALGPPVATTGSRPTRSSCSRSGTATPSTSRAGTTWCGPGSRWSPRTRSAPARRSGTSSPPMPRSAGSARRSVRPSPTSQQLFRHVVSQDTSGRNATNTFLSGQGRRAAHVRERGPDLADAGHRRRRTSSPGRRC